MTGSKPRGSLRGIIEWQSVHRDSSRKSLEQALSVFRAEKSNVRWTKIAVCRSAGLASTVALKKPWNEDLLEVIDKHNFKIKENIEFQGQQESLPPNLSVEIITRLKIALATKDAELEQMRREIKLLRKRITNIKNTSNSSP